MDVPGFLQTNVKENINLPREENENFGFHSSLKTGFRSVPKGPNASHPLEKSLETYDEKMLHMRMDIVQRTQGIHAPIQLQMELDTSSKGVKRLPCLSSTNLSREIILGTDTGLSAKDIYNVKLLNKKARIDKRRAVIAVDRDLTAIQH